MSFHFLVFGCSALSLYAATSEPVGVGLQILYFLQMVLFLSAEYFVIRKYAYMNAILRSIWDSFRLSYIPPRSRWSFILYAIIY